jgi:hypothetical protein
MEEPRRPTLGDLWKIALAIIGLVAVIQELRKPPEERTWQGKVANFVPYDFRMPTLDRVKATYWNPRGPALSGKVFGVGWAPNLGAVTRLLGGRRTGDAQGQEVA